MVLLHIASIENNPFNGVCVAVPQQALSQMDKATVGFMNIANIEIESLEGSHCEVDDNRVTQIPFNKKNFNLDMLQKPFNMPDLVIFHECYRVDYLSISRKLRSKGIPYIIVPHGELREEAQRKKHFKKVVANFLLFNRFIRGAEGIQCLSNAEIEATNFHNNRFLGTNGVTIPSEFKSSFNNKQTHFIYIGRYEWYVKGLDLLFDAIKEIKEALIDNNCHFDLYGPDRLGRFESVTQMINDRDITELVTLHLEITGQEKIEKLLESDVFVQTSRHEGMPMGILEALSFGIPCLLTEGTTLANSVADNKAGWNAGSTANSIAESLLTVIDQKEIFGFYSTNAIEYVKNNYSWEKVSGDTLIQYEEIVKRFRDKM